MATLRGTLTTRRGNLNRTVKWGGISGDIEDQDDLIEYVEGEVGDVSDDLTAHTSNVSNPHSVTKSQVGLGNVDNTSDLNKPLSTAATTALSDKVDEVWVNGVNKNETVGNKLVGKVVVPTKTSDLTNDGDGTNAFLTQHQSLADYRTSANQDVIDNAIKADIDDIEALIPSQATSSNQLADKNFVNSSIGTSTATFRGTSASGLTEQQFLAWANSLTHDLNDYVFWNTVDANGNTLFKRYKYNGTQWIYEYSLNNSSFTAAQWATIQSGLSSADKTKLDGIQSGAEVNVQSDWNQTNVSADDYIKNKPSMSDYATKTWVEAKNYITNAVNNLLNYFTKTEVNTLLGNKQDTLVSGTNIKTVNNQTLMGSGNISVGGDVQSVNGKTGVVVLDANDVGALPSSTSIPTKTSDLTNDGDGTNPFLTQHQSLSAYRTSSAQDLIDATKENTSNKVTSLSSSSTDTQYPSAKVTYDELKARIETIALTDGSETLAQLKARIDAINTAGRHVFFDTSSLNASMYLCTIYIDGTSKYRITDAVTGKTSIGDYVASKTLLTILNEAIADLVTITVTCTTQDGVTVTGQTVTLRNGTSAEAPVLATKSYNGQPVTFVVSKDTVYYVSVTDTLAEHFNPTTAQGVAVNNVSAILTYSDIHHVNTWAEIQQVVQMGFGAQAFPVGTTFNINVDGLGSTVWTVMHHITGGVSGAISLKNNKQYGMILQSRDCLYNGLFPFDDKEAFYSNETQMSAGTYNFKLGEHTWRSADVGKYYEFTTTEDIPANAQFVFQQGNSAPLEGASVKVFANGLSTVEITSFTLTEGQTGTYLGELKHSFSGNFNSCQRAFFGNNRWKESFERQFLNSNLSNSWWEAKNKWDRSHSYQANSGFMYRLPSDFKAVLGQVDLDTVLNNVCDGGGKETTTDTFFLPTRSECYGGAENAYDNGVAWQQYINAIGTDTPTTGATAGRVKVSIGTSTARWWWWRDPYTGNADGTRIAGSSGDMNGYAASGSYASAPACVIC